MNSGGERLHIALAGPMHPRGLAHHVNSTAVIPDGPPTPINELAEGLLELGHRVTVFTSSPDVVTTMRLLGEHLDIVVVPYRRRARARALDFFRYERRALEVEMRNSAADVLHAHWTYEFALAAIASGKSPVLVTAHDAPFAIFRHMPDAYRLVRAAMAIRTRFVIRELTAVSPYLAQRWRREMFYRRPVSIISNIVPHLRPADQPPVRGRWVILDVADGSRRKNVKTLIRAFAMVVRQFPQAELRLVGPGLGEHDPIAEWARSSSLDARITFVGQVDRSHIANEYARASVFCHPSREESQGVSLLEALDAGLVVIGGMRSGAVPWTLFGGRAGILVDVKRASAVADGIIEGLDWVGRGYSLQPQVARAVDTRHGRESVTQDYVTLYRHLISQSRRILVPGQGQ